MKTEIHNLPNMFFALKAILGSDKLVEQWWHSPNLAFDSLSPQEVFEQDSYTVVQYVLNQLQR